MALFKIEKGLASNLSKNRKTTNEGYCYFTTDDGKFYIDIATGSDLTKRICLNAYKADQWKDAITVNGLAIDGTTNVTNYGICSTDAATVEKSVSCNVDAGGQPRNYVMGPGAEVTVKFTVTNTAENPKLNVNNTGAQPIYYRGAAISKGYLAADRTYTFRYNGSGYELVGDINTDTNNKVTQVQVANSVNANYHLLLASSTKISTSTADYVKKNGSLYYNPNTQLLVSPKFSGTLSGKATSAGVADAFAAAKTITLTGDVNGTSSSTGGWTISTTLATTGVSSGSYGLSSNISPAFSSSFSIPYITVDTDGRITSATTHTVTLPKNPNSDTKVTNTVSSTATKIYITGTTTSTTATGTQVFSPTIYLNASTQTIVASKFSGTATKAETADSVNWSNIVSKPTSLPNPKALTVGSKTYNGSSAVTITAADLGLTGAMLYKGTTSTAITDGGTEAPTIGGSSVAVSNLQAGNVVLYGSKEFVWNGSKWELLGDEGSYKIKQTAVADPDASGTATAFITSIQQDTNGVISVAKKNLPQASTSVKGIVQLTNSVSSTSTTTAATPNSVKQAYDLAASKADPSLYLPLSGGTLTGNLTGKYITGTWLQTTETTNQNAVSTQVAVIDDAGWLYYRTPAQIISDAGVTATVTELNYVDGVTSNIQTQLNNKLPLSGGTITGNVLFSNSSAQSGQPNLKWKTITNSSDKTITPFVGYCTASSDGTFVVSSLEGTSYTTGLAIGGSSGNLIWKGNKIIDKSDITNKAPTLSWGNTSTVATINNGTPTPITLTVKMPNNPDTHYEASLFATSSTGTAHAATTNGNTYLRLFDNGTKISKQSINIKGTGSVSVTSDANGVITINSPIGVSASGNNIFTGTNQFDGILKIGPDNYGTGAPTAENQIYFVEDNGITVPKPSTSQNDYVLKVSNGNPAWSSNVASGIKTSANSNTIYVTGVASSTNTSLYYNNNVKIQNNVLMGAAWNDYAEYRICKDNFKPGQVICENGNDTLSISIKRLQPGAEIVSDTFGFAIGETQDAKCPVAVSGRVLAYTYEPREEFRAGDAVCAGPNGTVSKMTREEIREYPDRIIGTVSAIPSYEIWNETVKVNNRIWIKIK